MTNYNDYRTLKTLEEFAEKLGFKIGPEKHRHYNSPSINFSLFASDDNRVLPVYARDMELFTGDAETCISYLRGWSQCKDYMTMLGFNEKKITAAETKYADKIEFDRIKYAVQNLKDPGVNYREDNTKDMPF